ncbi:peptide chain release factor N(5)-glutamine methyltransferase [Labrenzia sp. OB1]|uniref:peptide chain release factor N(5)-glutamine methyltransferase n=1 Tax=Labrenzia sp. OB1 TaxID=1561204 RepID=UPI0007B2F304|nr:peptide chain release factor N(5)-glutamine methyltransferase [Labrenzia sp. OB1]KZM50491.1 protoporphyrinogen oxidase [Labrenzia sp. OB1]
MRIGQLYRQVRDRFRQSGLATPDLDARVLVSAALNVPVSALVLREDEDIPEGNADRALAYETLRLNGMPVGRILGERDFYGRKFALNAATLEPRPDTETLVDAVLARVDPQEAGVMCDIGTGSGAIAVTLLAERPGYRMIAVDLSEEALQCALGNAALHDVEDRFNPVCADYTSCLGAGLDWVVSNPPYIRSSVLAGLDREVNQHDPLLALDGGDSGLEAYLRIVADAAVLLRPGGGIALEIGYDQADYLKKQLRHHGFVAIEIIKDLSGNDRVALARKP